MISPDKPKIKLEDDLFERTKYAENLAKIILDQSHQEGFVMGVYGTWGSGKSTFLEYILRYLEQSTQSSNNSLITVVRFNPWWFSGKQDLTIALLRELQFELQNTHGLTNEQKKELIKITVSLISAIASLFGLPIGNALIRIVTSFSKNAKYYRN